MTADMPNFDADLTREPRSYGPDLDGCSALVEESDGMWRAYVRGWPLLNSRLTLAEAQIDLKRGIEAWGSAEMAAEDRATIRHELAEGRDREW